MEYDGLDNEQRKSSDYHRCWSRHWCGKEAVKRMSTRHGGSGGVIVNVSSGAARSGSPNEYIDYAASK